MKTIVKQSKTLRLFILLALSMLVAQTSFAQFRFGPSVGVNCSTILEDDVDNDFLAGLRAGLTFDLGIAKWFSISPEVNYNQMGYKFKGEGFTETGRINYIHVPINLVFKIKMSPDSRFILFPGFYGAYAVSGNIKVKSEGGDTEKAKVTFGTNEGQLNPLDLGLNIGLGFDINSILIKFQFNSGINSLNNSKTYSMLNGCLTLSLGYLF